MALEKAHQWTQYKSQKYCHYYYNDKSCPFEEIGCKFQKNVCLIESVKINFANSSMKLLLKTMKKL